MKAIKASQSSQSGRMFESDFFEFFSHIHPWQPPLFFVPIILGSIYLGFAAGVGLASAAGLFFAGLLFWTLLEYWLHRLVFHYEPSGPFGKRLIWLLHGVHHDWPYDKLRLVFPPTLSLPLAGLFFALYTWALGPSLRWPMFAGLCLGYLCYDMIHYWVHHYSPKSRAGKFLRRYHLEHHFKNPNSGYGVSNPLWDFVFATTPPNKGRDPGVVAEQTSD
ncbi:MAG: sterol desaturase family protein [Deltaproteobacteria bacterium]|nr:sterol desaturase family protein [Deltaproteobacteria bacterium]